jgi:hypothetical protein
LPTGQENPGHDGNGKAASEATYLTLEFDKSSRGFVPSLTRSVATSGSQPELGDCSYLSFGASPFTVSESKLAEIIQQTGGSGVTVVKNGTAGQKSAQMNYNRFMSCASIDSSFNQVSPLFHSTPDLDYSVVKHKIPVNIPVIHINDQLIFVPGEMQKSARMSSSAPDLSPESECKSRGQNPCRVTPYPRDIRYSSDQNMTNSSRKYGFNMSTVRPRPRPSVSPLAGVRPGQICSDLFTPKSVGIKLQSEVSPNQVLSC